MRLVKKTGIVSITLLGVLILLGIALLFGYVLALSVIAG